MKATQLCIICHETELEEWERVCENCMARYVKEAQDEPEEEEEVIEGVLAHYNDV